MQSIVQQRGSVAFPQFMGERHHMRPFFTADGLPSDLARWQPTVDAMLDGIYTEGPVYIMIDEGVVKAGTTHRRPRMHLDGFWIPELSKANTGYAVDPDRLPADLLALYAQYNNGHHGVHRCAGGRHGHRIEAAGLRHEQAPSHRSRPQEPRHQERPRHFSGNMGGSWETGPQWVIDTDGYPLEGIILASNVQACRALEGEWEGEVGQGGDVSHIDLSGLREHMLAANTVYAGNVTMLHESLPIPFDCHRALVRLNVPGWTPSIH